MSDWPGYFAFVRAVRDDQTLKSPAKMILLMLALRTDDKASAPGTCWVGYGKITRDTGLSRRTITNHLPELAGAGWVTITRRATESGAQTSHLYRLTIPVSEPSDLQEPENVPNTGFAGGAGDAPGGVQEMHRDGAGDAPEVPHVSTPTEVPHWIDMDSRAGATTVDSPAKTADDPTPDVSTSLSPDVVEDQDQKQQRREDRCEACELGIAHGYWWGSDRDAYNQAADWTARLAADQSGLDAHLPRAGAKLLLRAVFGSGRVHIRSRTGPDGRNTGVENYLRKSLRDRGKWREVLYRAWPADDQGREWWLGDDDTSLLSRGLDRSRQLTMGEGTLHLDEQRCGSDFFGYEQDELENWTGRAYADGCPA